MAKPTSLVAMNIMLAVHEKKTTSLDLYRPLRHYISATFSERDAQSCDDDLLSVQDMRAELDKPVAESSSSSLEARRDLLLSYYKSLSLIEPRFSVSFSFTWYDAFKPSKKCSVASIHVEKAAVLFNLGAIYSQIALAADRTTANGLKTACNAFQTAAGAFAYLKENVAGKAAAAGATVDLSPECAGMLERLMLAQAQECFFEKVIGDGKPPGLCSKVARQVGLYYEEAFALLSAPPLSQHFDKTWVAHVQLKAAQFYGEALYRHSLELHEKEEIAEEIARLKIGLAALADTKKISKGVAAPLLDSVSKLEASMKSNLERATKENDRVYLMRVPPADKLSSLPGASLVKASSMVEMLDASKERMFSGVVPDGSMKALSKYTEMVDVIIRTQAEKLQQASEITRVRLKEMDLPDSILSLEGNITLPLDLKEDVEAVQISGGPASLESELQQLRDLRRVNQELLVQTEEMLQKEATEDTQFRTQFGTRWSRPQSSTLTKNLQDRLNKFAANIKQAADSDARIERAVGDNAPLMSILDRRPIEAALPSIARPIMSLDGNEDAIVGALKQSLRQLEALGAQRAGLEDMLKDMKRKDDILPKLMAGAGSHDDLFKKEISKYDQICEEIAQNIEAQEQLLMQIQAQNDQFSSVFNLEDYKVAREKCYKQISAAIAKYREIKDNINEGLKFYVTLQDAINNIKQQCSDFIMTRNIQCREMIEDVQRQIAGFNFSDSKPGSGYNKYHTSSPAPPSTPFDLHRTSPSPPPQPDQQSTSLPSHPSQPNPPPYHAPTGPNPNPSYNPIPNYNTNYNPNQYNPNQRPGYSQPYYPPYSNTPQPPYQQPYHPPTGPYQQPQTPASHEYGQPAYPGWRGPYYNSHQQPQQGPYPAPAPPHNMQQSYPPHNQGGYYRPPQ